MEKLDLALRNYQRVRRKPQIHLAKRELRHLEVWLTHEVLPVLEQYAARPSFREQATWVLRALRPGSGTPERQEVDAVDAALVCCARLLSTLVAKRRIQAQLAERYPPRNHVIEGTPEMSGKNDRPRSQKWGPVNELAMEISQVATMVNRPWGDLARAEDYFEPQQELVQLEDGTYLQLGQFIVSLNPELPTVGNYVVRCLFHRIEISVRTLESLKRKVLHAVREIGQTYRDQEKFEAAWKVLQVSLAALRRTHQTGTAPSLRDDCMILTQVYAALHPSPDLTWLDVPQERVKPSVPEEWHKLIGLHNGEVFDRIAAALRHLKQLYIDGIPDQSVIEEAISAGGLVIDESTRRVWWNREIVKTDWIDYPKGWKFLVKLAEKALHRADVQERDIFEEGGAARSAMATLKSRLQKLLRTASLRKLIVPGRDLRSYRLEIEPNLVRLFELKVGPPA